MGIYFAWHIMSSKPLSRLELGILYVWSRIPLTSSPVSIFDGCGDLLFFDTKAIFRKARGSRPQPGDSLGYLKRQFLNEVSSVDSTYQNILKNLRDVRILRGRMGKGLSQRTKTEDGGRRRSIACCEPPAVRRTR
jgi:hypothetical protein